MALLLLKGTSLETTIHNRPLNKLFLILVGSLYLFFIHIPSWFDNGQGIERYSNLITWLSVLALLGIGITQIAHQKALRYSKLSVGLLLCCILLTLPVFESDANIMQILPKLGSVWLGWFFFLVLQQFPFSNKHKQRFLWFIVLSSLIGASIGYLKIAITLFSSPEQNLATEPLYQYQPSAIFFITGIISSGYLLARQIRKYQLDFSPVFLLYVTPLVTLPLILQRFSPSIWLILAVSIAAILRYILQRTTAKRLVGWSLSLMFGTLLGTMALYVSLQDSNHLLPASANNLFLNSITQTTDMLVERPFTGYGYGRFTEEYVLYTARQHALNASFPPAIEGLISPQSEILSWIIDGGLLPFLAVTLSGLFILFRGYFAKKGARLGTFSLLFPIILGSLCTDILYHSHILWITLLILLYWLDQRVTRYKLVSVSHWKIQFIKFTGMVALISVSLLLAIIGNNHYYYEKYRQTSEYSALSNTIVPTIYKDKILIAKIRFLLEKDPQTNKLESALPELLKIIKKQPAPSYYQLLIQCYEKLNQKNKALQTTLEYQYLFPGHQVE